MKDFEKRWFYKFILFLLILIIPISLKYLYQKTFWSSYVLGGMHHAETRTTMQIQTGSAIEENYSERYQRPSKQAELPNPYSLSYFMEGKKVGSNPEDVIYAYYGLLKEASNMEGYTGGCGTIGEAGAPYPYAYQLLSTNMQKGMSLQQFKDTFKGIGHITFLKIYPAYRPPNTPEHVMYYMVEIEVITGRKEKETEEYDYAKQQSLFGYYYGIITVKKENTQWKIDRIDYLSEDFLCAPYHSWFYDANAVVPIIYMENLKIITEVTKTQENNGYISVYATGNGNQYRFDFVRLTNGHDILLHENIWEDGKWVETNLLKEPWNDFKLSVLNSNFQKNTKK